MWLQMPYGTPKTSRPPGPAIPTSTHPLEKFAIAGSRWKVEPPITTSLPNGPRGKTPILRPRRET
ncbi:hypothetical protein PtA15_8A248 [Puccinia triticina]|uniref:Uncharacterized protein n=1 Tax=Puccinia triticina TaxID=208348 RepID=A0ABY7CQ10_9BASI|nr:uncharacterized protein PtA15_8A248 [Puccinia triticina]WAQ87344.1 hypothetical protein PtA15_8A248 [Puccinia triticina]WAR57196.1 hypothetical protein PtB15_8B243 [Puccinia triticina]